MGRLYFFLLLLICARVSTAGVTESLEIQEYVVRADAGQNLLAAINSATPVHRGGRIFHGFTSWNVRWNFWWNADRNGLCKISESRVNLNGTVLLPKLVGEATAHRAQFEKYVASLRTHELGHFDIGKRAATSIDSFLLSLPPRGSCAALENEANEGAYRLLEKYKKVEEQYDVDTNHGKTQGAWLQN